MASAPDNRKKGSEDFIYLASHQLRNPVTRIRWMIELLLRTGKLTEHTKEYLTLIHTSTVRLNDLITVLLNVSRIERKKMVFSPHSLDLVKFVKSFLKEYASFSAKKNISLTFKKHPPVLQAVIDSAAFYNILQPLVLNAIEYTDKGGKIEVSLEKNKETFCLMVGDTGIGIPKKDQAHIFEKFTRASNAKALNQDGLGLGLYAAVQTVKLLKGKIWFESPAPGRGKQENKPARNASPARHADASHAGWHSDAGGGTVFYVELPLKHTKSQRR